MRSSHVITCQLDEALALARRRATDGWERKQTRRDETRRDETRRGEIDRSIDRLIDRSIDRSHLEQERLEPVGARARAARLDVLWRARSIRSSRYDSDSLFFFVVVERPTLPYRPRDHVTRPRHLEHTRLHAYTPTRLGERDPKQRLEHLPSLELLKQQI